MSYCVQASAGSRLLLPVCMGGCSPRSLHPKLVPPFAPFSALSPAGTTTATGTPTPTGTATASKSSGATASPSDNSFERELGGAVKELSAVVEAERAVSAAEASYESVKRHHDALVIKSAGTGPEAGAAAAAAAESLKVLEHRLGVAKAARQLLQRAKDLAANSPNGAGWVAADASPTPAASGLAAAAAAAAGPSPVAAAPAPAPSAAAPGAAPAVAGGSAASGAGAAAAVQGALGGSRFRSFREELADVEAQIAAQQAEDATADAKARRQAPGAVSAHGQQQVLQVRS